MEYYYLYPFGLIVILYQYLVSIYNFISSDKLKYIIKEFFSVYIQIPAKIMIILYYIYLWLYNNIIVKIYHLIFGKQKKHKSKVKYTEKVDSYWDFSEDSINILSLPKYEDFEKEMEKNIRSSMKLSRSERRKLEKEEKKQKKKKI